LFNINQLRDLRRHDFFPTPEKGHFLTLPVIYNLSHGFSQENITDLHKKIHFRVSPFI